MMATTNNNEKHSFEPKNTTSGSPSFSINENSTKSNLIEIPQITLPKGGGAIKGIDEKFQVNAANGTASFSIPLPLSPGRNGFAPSLNAGYNSGAGNSVLGIGWGLDFLSIQRKTDKRLPRYRDVEESDVFMFSGVEDLVPALKVEAGEGMPWVVDTFSEGQYVIRRYRPRIEGVFSRIERIQHPVQGAYWKVTTRDNIVTFFGRNTSHRLCNPANPEQIFQWLPELSFDDKGNCIVFQFKQEDGKGVTRRMSDQNRFSADGTPIFSQQYLKSVKYNYLDPFLPDYGTTASPDWDNIYNPKLPAGQFLMELVFDYGEHGTPANGLTGMAEVHYDEQNPWLGRNDAFSDYKAGFEVRTCRLCRRVLLYHHFGELGSKPCLVRSLDFQYRDWDSTSSQLSEGGKLEVTYLDAALQRGYLRAPTETTNYTFEGLPPIEFKYQELQWNREVIEVSPEDALHAPVGLSGTFQWIDFYGEGISGILCEQGDCWHYKRNLGDGHFTPAKPVIPKPSLTGLSNGALQLNDLEADGRKQLVVHSRGLQGYFQMTETIPAGKQESWEPFQAFLQNANVDVNDPNTRLIDLDGDGRPEIVVSEENAFRWYPSLGVRGYDSSEIAYKAFDEERGPAIVFADDLQRIYLADMSGDGLTDIVRIRNGEVCYWPNLGYGRFGCKVTMNNAPWFDTPELFHPAYLHLADISGTGATDLIYLGKNQFKAWLNISGNTWSTSCLINPFPQTAQPGQLSVTDFLGAGTSCIVWSSPLAAHAGAPMRYIDLMGSQKPHLLVGYANNMGSETMLRYRNSTWFYLQAAKTDRPWITKLPFPVHCVAEVEHWDYIAQTRFCNRYEYHHGYYDHPEGEFRGFGKVIQVDAEEYEVFVKSTGAGSALTTEAKVFQKPVKTVTWFHTGAFLGRDKMLSAFAKEYYQNPSLPEYLPPDPDLSALSTGELAEACRAFKGLPLRQEVYALDGTESEEVPYSTAQHTYAVQRLQPRLQHKHAVFLPHESEAITYHYERVPEDPRCAHNLNLEFNELGHVTKSAAVVYGRTAAGIASLPDLTALQPLAVDFKTLVKKEQQKIHIIYTETDYTSVSPTVPDIDRPEVYRLRQAWNARTYEVTGLTPDGTYFSLAELQGKIAGTTEIPYEKTPTGPAQKRKIEQVCTLFMRDDQSGPMPAGTMDTLGLPWQNYQLAFTPDLLNHLYGSKVTPAMLANGKYQQPLPGDTNWWIGSGRQVFDATHFYLPVKFMDNWGNTTDIHYDTSYHIYIAQRKAPAPISNEVQVALFNFRTLSPVLMQDANDNLSGARYDTLGRVSGVFAIGKMSGGAFNDQGDEMNVASTEADPAKDFPSATFEYNLDAWYRQQSLPGFVKGQTPPQPNYFIGKTRVFHKNDPDYPDDTGEWRTAYSYAGGNGQILMQKVEAEKGDAPLRDAAGMLLKDPATGLVQTGVSTDRWVGNGRTILNNKGNPVKQYEPFFDSTPAYNDETELRLLGHTPVLYYDPIGRLIRTEQPNGTYSKVEFSPWHQTSRDENDTVKDSDWYTQRIGGGLGSEEKDAALKAEKHAETPVAVHLDSLGRPFLSIADNGADGRYATYTLLDIEGNLLEVRDARNNAVMRYQYDMLGLAAHTFSMDAGERWMFGNAMRQPMHAWDSRNHVFRYEYDALHRPVQSFVRQTGDPAEKMYDRIEYGESAPNAKKRNLRGQVFRHADTAGLLEHQQYDFKGNLLAADRTLLKDYKNEVNWSGVPALEAETFSAQTRYDALNRPKWSSAPDGSEILHEFNRANLLEKIKVKLPGAAVFKEFVKNIDYDAKGRRERIQYGNGTSTRYEYDPVTQRLQHLKTYKGATNFQDLYYWYDPVGNITQIEDRCIPTQFFNNHKILPRNRYTYDALYRLVEARGKEHAANAGHGVKDNWDDLPFLKQYSLNENFAWQDYTQTYQYDAVGNFITMKHSAGTGGWTRTYVTENASNRLKSTTIGTHTYNYAYNDHGSMTKMPHLEVMDWNFKEELQHAKAGNSDLWFTYDAGGERVRKVFEKAGGLMEERIYVGGFEVFRRHNAAGLDLERTTLHIADDTGRIALVETRTEGAPDGYARQLTRYQYGNHLGSAALELSDAAEVISYEEYHPYGTTALQVRSKAVNAVAKRYRYTGMERDEETGLAYHSARYYAGWLGRWCSADPIGIGDGVNLYLFAKNNPLIYMDRSGTLSSQELKYLKLTLIEKYGGDSYFPDKVSDAKVNDLFIRYVVPHLTQKTLQYFDVLVPPPDEPMQLVQGAARTPHVIYTPQLPGKPDVSVEYLTDEEAEALQKQIIDNASFEATMALFSALAKMGTAKSANQGKGKPLPDYRVRQWSAPVHNTRSSQGLEAKPVLPEATKPSVPTPSATKATKTKVAKDGVSEIEFRSGIPVPAKRVLDEWNKFLGEGYSNINPITGVKDPDRLWSKDGNRSIRYGPHEMNYEHYHYEVWGKDSKSGDWVRLNVYKHIQTPKHKTTK